jgi:hypothetical protein
LSGWRPGGTTNCTLHDTTDRDRWRHNSTANSRTRGVEMNGTSARENERSALADETRTSAFLLGGALGSMGLFALLLLFLTAGWPAR